VSSTARALASVFVSAPERPRTEPPKRWTATSGASASLIRLGYAGSVVVRTRVVWLGDQPG
jgi:hypothetical protein